MSRARAALLAALGLTLLLGFAARAVTLDHESLWRDEVDALRFASVPWPEMRASFTRMGFNGPLYHLLLRAWIGAAGTTEYGLRYFSLWFGVVCVALAYALGRRLFGPAVGLIAALLTACSPYLVWYSQEVKMYTLVPALALAALYAMRRAVLGHGWWWWAFQVAATSLAFYSHILAALLIPVQVALFFVWWRRARRQWAAGLISLSCLTVPYVPLLVWQWRLITQARDTGFAYYAPGHMAQVLLSAWSVGMAQFPVAQDRILKGVVLGLAAWGVLSPLVLPLSPPGTGQDPSRTRVPVWSAALENILALIVWIVVPAAAVAVVSLWQPIFTDRYLIWSAPAFYLLVSAGLGALLRVRSWGRPVAALLLGVLLLFAGVALRQQARASNKSDFRGAAAYVAGGPAGRPVGQYERYLPLISAQAATEDPGGDVIVFQIPYARHTFDYYFPRDGYAWADGPYTNRREADGSYTLAPEIVAQYMVTTTAPYQSVWLVLTEADMWDERGLTYGWLEANGQRTDEAHFTRIDVYRYWLGQER